MIEIIRNELAHANSLDEVRDGLTNLFQRIKQENPRVKIYYVSGIITSDGPEFIQRNIEILANHTERIREKYGPYVFSATDVFSQELFDRIDANGAKNDDYIKMWRELFETSLVDGIFMTPRWQKSKGAIDEHDTFQRLDLEIFEITSE